MAEFTKYENKTMPALPDMKNNSGNELFSAVEEVIDQLDVLKIESSRNEENHKPRSKTKHGNSQSPNSPRADEGYESDTEDSMDGGGESVTSVSGCPSREPPTFTITHTIRTDPKSQHFSRIINLFAHNSNDIETGYISARYTNFPLLRASASKYNSKSKANFYTSMQELNTCNSDGLAFATALFCRKGTLLKKHRSGEKRYPGPWGSELERSPVLLLHYLCVQKEFRRQGLARLLMNSLIEKAKECSGKNQKGMIKFVLVFPAMIREDFEAELEGKTGVERVEIEKRYYDNAVKFYRALGFRRIGMSKWFGFALDKEHASRKLKVEDELDPPEEGL